MNGTHPTAEQLERYRRRTAAPAEMIRVDAHIASCDRCFEAVRADAHLSLDRLEALADDDRATDPHLALCAACREELEDLRKMRDALREEEETPRRRWPLAAAAMLVMGLAAAALWFRADDQRRAGFSPPPGGLKPAVRPAPQVAVLERPRILDTLITKPAVLRGNETNSTFALHAPVATVVLDERPRFRWENVQGATSYEITILDLDTGTVAATGTTTNNAWETQLPRGRTYVWQVAADTPRGRIVSPGRGAAEARFHVAEQTTVSGVTPRDRGIALANLGALDDAERELKAAGADDLLQQIRTWRDSPADRRRPGG